ncbi:MAG: hypothetical protein LUQ19_03760 [Methanoregula sp.]|nr:hypothetical protein [Methanoregula sp.]
MRSGQVLIFIYNCDRGNLSAIRDYSKKTVEEKAPECSLLALISSPVGMKKSWKRFIGELDIPSRFLHRDEYEEEFGAILAPLPVVLLHSHKTKSLFISADELSRVQALEDLILLVSHRLATLT